MTGHLANGEHYGVDGVTIGEANKRLVVCKQLEQEFVATETQNSISSKFQKKTLQHLQQQPFVTNLCNNFCNGLFSLSVW